MRNQNSHPKGNQRPSSAAQEAPAGKLSREQEQAEAGSRPFKKRFIKREGRRRTEGKEGKGGRKPHKRTEERDLDRELRDYWLTQKGGKADEGNCTGPQLIKPKSRVNK